MSYDPDQQIEGDEGSQETRSSGHHYDNDSTNTSADIGTDEATIEWLNKNNLGHLISSFKKFGATLEILTMLDETEIKQLAKETLHLNIIDTAKLVKVTKALKNNSNLSKTNNNTNNNTKNNSNNSSLPPATGYIFLGPTEQKYMQYIQTQLSIVQEKCSMFSA